MGTRHAQGLLVLFLLGASWTLAQNLSCHKGTSLNIDDSPSTAFNWTTEKVETCDNGSLCQESALMIKAGTNAAILTTKGCSSEGTQAVTFVQHSPPPGIMIVSYSSYCEDSLCNNRVNLPDLWNPSILPVTLHCPTCVALGSCLNAPSLPCPSGTTRCYQGKLKVTGGDIDSTLEVKGCTSTLGCRLMSGILTVGPMWVKEMCPHQSTIQSRNIENGATTWFPISFGRLELLLLLLLL
uniref:Testis expressed 101 n=1 Tax=Molossus molossus TaxID=27622 RepID=A0A7J8CBK7_MOLMO|nr:testis expressed 101 [Molossus molossus]